jgi:hypothetical protein
MVDMMLADGIVDDSEMDFCCVMAQKLGYKESVGLLRKKKSRREDG